MAVPTYTVVCTRREEIAPGVYEFAFEKPKDFRFAAGQFVLFDVPLIDNPADTQPRAYSIASTSAEADLLFVVKLTPGGRFSRYLEQILRVGTTMTMKGPFGMFTLDAKTTKPYLFIATGAGVAPFRSHIKWALEEASEKRSMQLIFGVRESNDLFWVNEFEGLMKRFANFKLHISLTSGEPDWDGHRGRVLEIAEQLKLDWQNQSVYICGAPEMVADVKKKCLETWAVPKADVHAEGYI